MDSVPPLVEIIVGARPNFVKIAPIIHAMRARQADGSRFKFRLVHAGQHCDPRISGDFFAQFGIPQPGVDLETGSGSQAGLVASIMLRYEQLLLKTLSNLFLCLGFVRSNMACTISAYRSNPATSPSFSSATR